MEDLKEYWGVMCKINNTEHVIYVEATEEDAKFWCTGDFYVKKLSRDEEGCLIKTSE